MARESQATMQKRFATTVRAQTPVPDDDADRPRWHLCVVHSPDAPAVGQAFPLKSRETRLGRDPD
jgi:hypothetical protein